jgi:hypothetical protein
MAVAGGFSDVRDADEEVKSQFETAVVSVGRAARRGSPARG